MHTEVREHRWLDNRDRDINQVLGLLKQYPLVFVWAPSGNGKSCFGREFERHSSIKAEFAYPKGGDSQTLPEDGNFFEPEIKGAIKIVVIDEFACPFGRGDLVAKSIDHEIRGGRRFVLLVHEPRSSYLDYKRLHKGKKSHIINLIKEYPDAPWMYLRKWRPLSLSTSGIL